VRIAHFIDELERTGRVRKAVRSGSVITSIALQPDPAAPRWRDVLRDTRVDRGGA
jgi:hypothetical protein